MGRKCCRLIGRLWRVSLPPLTPMSEHTTTTYTHRHTIAQTQTHARTRIDSLRPYYAANREQKSAPAAHASGSRVWNDSEPLFISRAADPHWQRTTHTTHTTHTHGDAHGSVKVSECKFYTQCFITPDVFFLLLFFFLRREK